MPEDVSLDQFASPETTDSEDAEENADAESELDDAVPESDEPEPDESEAETLIEESEIAPAVSTYSWSSEGGECADCGGSAERLWRGDGQKAGGLVCPDCKEW